MSLTLYELLTYGDLTGWVIWIVACTFEYNYDGDDKYAPGRTRENARKLLRTLLFGWVWPAYLAVCATVGAVRLVARSLCRLWHFSREVWTVAELPVPSPGRAKKLEERAHASGSGDLSIAEDKAGGLSSPSPKP